MTREEIGNIFARIERIRHLVDWIEMHRNQDDFFEIRRELNDLTAEIRKITHELIVGEKA